MSVDHLDVLHAELPELFQPRDLSSVWDENFIVVPIEDPEWLGEETRTEGRVQLPLVMSANFLDLESTEVDFEFMGTEALSFSPVIRQSSLQRYPTSFSLF